MKLLVTGGCGFVGSALARHFAEHVGGAEVTALDSLRRAGSEPNHVDLRRRGVVSNLRTPIAYGATKLASEVLAFEYAAHSGMPLIVDRCGVIAGAGQFGRADQGIFSFWIHSWRAGRPLRYIGSAATGTRCATVCARRTSPVSSRCRSPALIRGATSVLSMSRAARARPRSLRQLSEWCRKRFGPHAVTTSDETRPFDLSWLILDHAKTTEVHGWRPEFTREAIFDAIVDHAERHPDWLDRVND